MLQENTDDHKLFISKILNCIYTVQNCYKNANKSDITIILKLETLAAFSLAKFAAKTRSFLDYVTTK
jgi:hypothetical protein